MVAGLGGGDRGAVSTVVRYAVEVDAPPEAVWAVVSDPRNLPHWDRHVEGVEGLPAEGLRRGAEYTTVVRFMGVHARVRARVLAWEPPGRAVLSLSGVLEGTVETTVRPLADRRSLLGHEVTYRFHGPLGGFAARSLQLLGGAHLVIRHGTLAQKRQVEGEA